MDESVDTDSSEPLLRAYLHERSVACPACGYDLRNLHAARCPECANPIELAIRLSEPRIGSLLTGLSALVAGAGFSSLMTLYLLIVILIRGIVMPPQIWRSFVEFTSVPAAIQIALVVVYLRRWNAIRTLPAPRRRLLVIACWAVPLINIVLFSANIR